MHGSRSPFLPLVIAASSLASCASPAERAAVGESREGQRAAVAMPDSRFGGGGRGVQFHDSHDVHVLDVATGKTKRVASPVEHAECATIPLLARDLESQSRRHRTVGALYVLSEPDVSESQPSVVVLRDADLDGSIDNTSVMSLEAFREAGYLTSEAWID